MYTIFEYKPNSVILQVNDSLEIFEVTYDEADAFKALGLFS